MSPDETFSRNKLFWGEDAQKKLADFSVAVFGLGGVGGYCVEMLARSGIGKLTLVDFDEVSQSNINRQIIATQDVGGEKKTELFEKRLKSINPKIKINLITDFYTQSYDEKFSDSNFDFIADAIDTMRSKVSLIEFAHSNNIKIISSLGAGNRINPEKLYICDIKDIRDKKTVFTKNILYQLKKRGIEEGITVVTSDEKPQCLEKIVNQEKITTLSGENIEFNKITPASTPFVASTAGIFMASYIVRKLLNL